MAQDAGYELETCLAHADSCLYRAKNAGRDQVCYLPPEELTGDFQFGKLSTHSVT